MCLSGLSFHSVCHYHPLSTPLISTTLVPCQFLSHYTTPLSTSNNDHIISILSLHHHPFHTLLHTSICMTVLHAITYNYDFLLLSSDFSFHFFNKYNMKPMYW